MIGKEYLYVTICSTYDWEDTLFDVADTGAGLGVVMGSVLADIALIVRVSVVKSERVVNAIGRNLALLFV